jgi:hypothetical protein
MKPAASTMGMSSAVSRSLMKRVAAGDRDRQLFMRLVCLLKRQQYNT